MTTYPAPSDFVWHNGLGANLFAYGTTADGRAVKVIHFAHLGLVGVELLDGEMMPGEWLGSFDGGVEVVVERFGIVPR